MSVFLWLKMLLQANRHKGTLRVWKILDVGKFRSARAVMAAIEQEHMKVSATATNLLRNVWFSFFKRTYVLILVSLGELGLSGEITTEDAFQAAFDQGYAWCPAEVGPYLRLSYADQLPNSPIIVASWPLALSGDDYGVPVDDYGATERRLFTLANGSAGLLLGSIATSAVWGPDTMFVFRLK